MKVIIRDNAKHRMDSLMHDFYLRLQKLPYAKKINFILAGDHGMTEISPDRFVSWAEALDDSWVEDIAGAIPTSIYCKEGCIDTVYKALSQIPHPSCLAAGAQTAREFTLPLSDDGVAQLVVYLPEQPTGRAVVCCPGGGYAVLSNTHEGAAWSEFFNAKGIAFALVNYRIPHGDRTLPIGDAEQAMRTMRDSAAVWHLNPRDIGIMGSSAGGHLASTIATHTPYELRPDFQILR